MRCLRMRYSSALRDRPRKRAACVRFPRVRSSAKTIAARSRSSMLTPESGTISTGAVSSPAARISACCAGAGNSDTPRKGARTMPGSRPGPNIRKHDDSATADGPGACFQPVSDCCVRENRHREDLARQGWPPRSRMGCYRQSDSMTVSHLTRLRSSVTDAGDVMLRCAQRRARSRSSWTFC